MDALNHRPSHTERDVTMNSPHASTERGLLRKHSLLESQQDATQESPQRVQAHKRIKTDHNSPQGGGQATSQSSFRPTTVQQPSRSPEADRRSRSPPSTDVASGSRHRRLSISPSTHVGAPRAIPVQLETPTGGRPLTYSVINDPAVSSRTSAADAFRNIRAEGRDREATYDPALSSESRARFQAPISPADSGTSFGRPRVSSNASDRERRLDADGLRDRGHPLPSIRAPKSPAIPAHFNNFAAAGVFNARGSSHTTEGSALAPLREAPTILPSVTKLPSISHRALDANLTISGDRSSASLREEAHISLPPSSRQETHGPAHTERYVGHNHVLPASAPYSRRPSAPPHEQHEAAYAHSAGPSSGAPPANFKNHSDSGVTGAAVVPGSLSSLGSQPAAERKSAKQQPSFVTKLYSMLEDERISHMISWAPSGTVFSVANPSVFSKVVLPQWFKHSNWQSFVRQLNMYGFNKVNQTFQGDPIDEIQVWEFRHPRFRRGEVHLLNDIKRKNSRQKRGMSPTLSVSGGDIESRKEASPTPSPEMSSMSMDEHGRPNHDTRLRTEVFSHPLGQPSWQGPGPTHTGMPFAHDSGPMPQHPPPPPGVQSYHLDSTASGGSAHSFTAAQEPPLNPTFQEQQRRLNDMSERIDAIIRHSNYLESQLRNLSERLQQSQQNEQTIATHVTRTLGHLVNLGTDRLRNEETRQTILGACRAEMDFLRPYVAVEGAPVQGAPPPLLTTPAFGPAVSQHEGSTFPQPPPPGPMSAPHQPQHHSFPHSSTRGPPPPQTRGIQPVPVRSTSLLDRQQSYSSSDHGHGPAPLPSLGPYACGSAGPSAQSAEPLAYRTYRRESYESDGPGHRN